MKKGNLYASPDGSGIVRVVGFYRGETVIMDCKEQTMPVCSPVPDGYIPAAESAIYAATGSVPEDLDTMEPTRKEQAYRKYSIIAGILTVLGDRAECSRRISEAAEVYGVATQSVRNYLKRYLTYYTVSALADRPKTTERPLTQEEKTMRWALNKFYYTQHKNSLAAAYTMMLKAKYTDEYGVLKEHPSIHQFRYFCKKTQKKERFYVSRNGLKDYQMNHRPLLGDGVQEMAPSIGTAFLDSTTCDVYLVNEAGKVVGRPILTAAIDVNTSLCLGYSLSWEGGVYSLGHLLLNVLSDKVEFCQRLGVSVEEEQWPNRGVLPGEMITDRGAEYIGETFGQITELGVTLVGLPAFRAELKGSVERFFGLVQNLYTTMLKGKGAIMPDFQKRGAVDYRKEAVLTMADFEKVVARCVVYYNAERVLKNYPYTKEMLDKGVAPHAADIWRYLSASEANLIPVTVKDVALTLLPRTDGTFSRTGLKVNKLRYRADGYKEQYLTGGTAVVAYDPDDAGKVWLKERTVRSSSFNWLKGASRIWRSARPPIYSNGRDCSYAIAAKRKNAPRWMSSALWKRWRTANAGAKEAQTLKTCGKHALMKNKRRIKA